MSFCGGFLLFGVWVRVRELERPHAHGDAEEPTAEDDLISPPALGGRAARSGTAVGSGAGV